MKKQFFRVKQLTEQTFLKAEKSDVLDQEELQVADPKVDALGKALIAVSKKICPSGPAGDKDKRVKKCVEYQIGSAFLEGAQHIDSEKGCLLLQQILKSAGTTEQDLAREYAEHEAKVEELVYTPLQKVVDNEIPTIAKQKNALKRYCLDKDSVSSRYHATKKEALKEDMEEADHKVYQNRDALAIDVFSVLARENEFASYILQFLKLQRGFHESALKHLEAIIPQLEKTIGDSQVKKVFGVPLEEHLRVTNKKLAYPLEICISSISELGLGEEGLFRIAGALSKIKRLKAAIDSGCFVTLIPEYRDLHVLASTLKAYLRDLPEPLLTYYLYQDWMHMKNLPENTRVEEIKLLLNKLPEANRNNLAYLIQFLSRVAQQPDNKMNSSNIAIVIAPNLLWQEDIDGQTNMGDCLPGNIVVETLIKYCNIFFPDDMSRYVSISSLIPYEDSLTTYTQGNNSESSMNSKSPIENVDATSTESLLESPRPNTRRKKPVAPEPPAVVTHSKRSESDDIQDSLAFSYPTGSATLNRPPKGRDQTKHKATVGTSTEDSSFSLNRKRSFSKDDIKLLNISDQAGAAPGATSTSPSIAHGITSVNDVAASTLVTSVAINVAKAEPVIPSVAQTVIEEASFKTTATHLVGLSGDEAAKPTPAPRQSLLTDDRASVSRNSSMRGVSGGDAANKSEFGDVQLRRGDVSELSKPVKPEIPARPASLAPTKRSSSDADPSLHRTHLASVANKQQASIVNIQNRNEKVKLGHDVMMPEKEKFLGQSTGLFSSLENKFTELNLNTDRPRPASTDTSKPSVPPKSAVKSSESLNKSVEQLGSNDTFSRNQTPSTSVSKSSEKINELNEHTSSPRSSQVHTRTRSDGNIKELGQRGAHGPTPVKASPKLASKPSHPPPPPPVMPKPEPETTDF